MSGSSNLQPKTQRGGGTDPTQPKLSGGWPQIMWVNELTGFLMVDTAANDAMSVLQAEDKVIALTFSDPGTCRERVDTVETSSVIVGLTVTDTFTYTLVNGKYVPDGYSRAVA